MISSFEKLKENFKRLLDSGRLSHAYLLFGEEAEKFFFAQSLANFLENGIFERPSQTLREALIVSSDEKGTIGIDKIRELKYFLWQRPVGSSRRVAIIKEAEAMTTEAQNAVLKIVEEPPASALIIFITEVEDNLLPALISRLQKIYLPKSPEKALKTAGKSREKTLSQIGLDKDLITDLIENKDKLDEFFKSLIIELKQNPVKNAERLKETLNRLTLIKQFNVNKRLQLKALISLLK